MSRTPAAASGPTRRPEIAYRLLQVHVVLKGMLLACLIIPSVAVVLMTMGAWDIKGDDWDGALRMLAIVAGIVGVGLVTIIDRQ